MRARNYWMIGLVAVALIAVGSFSVARRPKATPTPATELGSAVRGAVAPSSSATLSTVNARKVVDKPRPPEGLARKVTDSGADSMTAAERSAWNAYLAETKKVVLDNADELKSVVDVAMAAIIKNDAAKLGTLFAPDETMDAAFIQSLATGYPKISSSNVQSSVGVFTVASSTVYYGYSVVRWVDAGLVSEHTIVVPLRFIGGKWYLTDIGSGTEGLLSVQSVQM
ncbi:MAG: hypothetical protein FD171_377 [Actinobacteria bacterium]|nr:MAG: hypothetical protein FD171_377 [Actinomycetota bacterium]